MTSPLSVSPTYLRVLDEIDVLWLRRNSIIVCLQNAHRETTIATQQYSNDMWCTINLGLIIHVVDNTVPQGPNFRNFRDPRPKCENKNCEIQNRENLNTWNFVSFTRAFSALVLLDLTSDDGTIWSDVWRWHYSAISNRQTTSYPLSRDIFHPPLTWQQ